MMPLHFHAPVFRSTLMPMNRACEGKKRQTPVRSFGCSPVVPPHPRRVTARDYEREPVQNPHETGRLFCRQERSARGNRTGQT